MNPSQAPFWNPIGVRPLRDEEDEEPDFSDVFERPDPSYDDALLRNRRWVVEGLIPGAFLIVLGGAPKQGKTCLATAIAFAVASGQSFAGMPTTQSPVLWCAFEESPYERAHLMSHIPMVGAPASRTTREDVAGEGDRTLTHDEIVARVDQLMDPRTLAIVRNPEYATVGSLPKEVTDAYEEFKRLYSAVEEDARKAIPSQTRTQPPALKPAPVYTAYEHPPIDTAGGLICLDQNIARYQPRLVVIDSLHGAVQCCSIGENTPARRVMQALKRIAYMHNCTILLLHHLTKSQSRSTEPDRFGDSTQILATASMHIHMEAKPWLGRLARESPDRPGPVNEQDMPGPHLMPGECPDSSDREDRPTKEHGRLVTLTTASRGLGVPTELHFLSRDLLEYEMANEPDHLTESECCILSLLTNGDLTLDQLMAETDYARSTVFHALTRLKELKLAGPVNKSAANRLYGLTR